VRGDRENLRHVEGRQRIADFPRSRPFEDEGLVPGLGVAPVGRRGGFFFELDAHRAPPPDGSLNAAVSRSISSRVFISVTATRKRFSGPPPSRERGTPARIPRDARRASSGAAGPGPSTANSLNVGPAKGRR